MINILEVLNFLKEIISESENIEFKLEPLKTYVLINLATGKKYEFPIEENIRIENLFRYLIDLLRDYEYLSIVVSHLLILSQDEKVLGLTPEIKILLKKLSLNQKRNLADLEQNRMGRVF